MKILVLMAGGDNPYRFNAPSLYRNLRLFEDIIYSLKNYADTIFVYTNKENASYLSTWQLENKDLLSINLNVFPPNKTLATTMINDVLSRLNILYPKEDKVDILYFPIDVSIPYYDAVFKAIKYKNAIIVWSATQYQLEHSANFDWVKPSFLGNIKELYEKPILNNLKGLYVFSGIWKTTKDSLKKIQYPPSGSYMDTIAILRKANIKFKVLKIKGECFNLSKEWDNYAAKIIKNIQ